jgi:hypothetical protein
MDVYPFPAGSRLRKCPVRSLVYLGHGVESQLQTYTMFFAIEYATHRYGVC